MRKHFWEIGAATLLFATLALVGGGFFYWHSLNRALFHARQRSDAPTVRTLLQKGARDRALVRGRTLLIQVASWGDTSLARMLLLREVDPNEPGTLGVTPLIAAAAYGHLEIVSLLLSNGADPDARTNEGQTALMRAADLGHTEVVRLLLHHGADAASTNQAGLNALELAERRGHRDIVRELSTRL